MEGFQMAENYYVSYMRRNGKQVDEFYNDYFEASTRRNTLISEFGYTEMEVKLTCQFVKCQ
jgi:hypothetical protein